MKNMINLLIQFVGYVLQTLPVVLCYLLTIIEVKGSWKWKRYVLFASGLELLSGAGFVCLCALLDWNDLPWQYCNLYMMVVIVIAFLLYWKASCLNLYYVMILNVLFIHYTAVVYTIDGIYINWGRKIYYTSFPYIAQDLLGYIVCNLVFFPLLVLFLKKIVFRSLFAMDKNTLRKTTELVLAVLLLYCEAAGFVDWNELDIWNIFLFFVVIFTDVAVYYIFFYIISLNKEKNNMEIQLMAVRYQKERMQRNVNLAKRIRHDNRQHLHVIRRLMEKQDYEGLKTYVDSCERSIGQFVEKRFCPYMVADELLAYYSMAMKTADIRLETKCEDVREEYPINSADMTVIIGNCLENAVEECCRLPGDRKREIFFQMRETKGKFLLLEIKNSCRKEKTEGKETEQYQSREIHGLGLYSVRSVLKKYHGDMEFWKKEGVFTMRLVIPVPPNSDMAGEKKEEKL